MMPALRACATSPRIWASDGAPGATKLPLPELAAAGNGSGLPTFPPTSRPPPDGSPGGSGSDRVRPPLPPAAVLPPAPAADAPVADVAVAELGAIAGECCRVDVALCGGCPDPGGVAVGEPPEPQPATPSAARPR